MSGIHEFRIQDGLLRVQCPAANMNEERPFTAACAQRLGGWSERYRAAVDRNQHHKLPEIGNELFDWLNGQEQWMKRILSATQFPLLLTFAIPLRPNAGELAFLEAPWEILAQESRFLALEPDTKYSPIRRIGPAGTPHKPSDYRLSLVFMAASPRDADPLQYEQEEGAILRATEAAGTAIDLTVEESGTLALLGATVASEKSVEVLHISCHGMAEPKPSICLETDDGEIDRVTADRLASELGEKLPRLIFISACQTAQPEKTLNSLAATLIRRSFPAVLAWAGSVRDTEATQFAGFLYMRLARKDSVEHAVAEARFALATQQDENRHEGHKLGERESHYWHMARLYLGTEGGGTLTADPKRARDLLDSASVYKEFLQKKGTDVPVAGQYEFVGRRRQIQSILRGFRQGKRGVIIHGMGRLGKSSLVARIAHRLKDYERVVLFRRYDAATLVKAIAEDSHNPQVSQIALQYPDAATDPNQLYLALVRILEGPCAQVAPQQNGEATAHPILLILDDFESVQDTQSQGKDAVKPQVLPVVREVIRAFLKAHTQSRLIFTTRRLFAVPHDGTDLTQLLVEVPLPSMRDVESKKQAAAKNKLVPVTEKAKELKDDLIKKIIEAGLGNPGLQDLLFRIGLANPAACENAIVQAQEHLKTGNVPSSEEVRVFMQRLAIDGLLAVLSASERELVRCSSLFEIPVPIEILDLLAEKLAFGDGRRLVTRLVGLGIFELPEARAANAVPSTILSALIRPRLSRDGEPFDEE